MAATPILNIVLKKGADYEATGTITDTASGAPIDISGDSFEAQIKEKATDSVALASFSFGFVSEGTDGQYVRSISAAKIDALSIEKGVWDMFWIQADGHRVKAAKGNIIIESDRVTV